MSSRRPVTTSTRTTAARTTTTTTTTTSRMPPSATASNLLPTAKSAGRSMPKKASTTTAAADTTATLLRRAKVDKKIVDELLLVCGVIGTVDPNTNEFVPVQECLNWLQDLQRTLRRDDDLMRPISLLLGKWNVLPQKLLPLCIYSGRYDRPLLLTLCRILVILTKPLNDQTKRAGSMVITPKCNNNNNNISGSGDANSHSIRQQNHHKVVQEQIWLRENAIEQANLLVEYKKAFCRVHSNTKKQGKASLFTIFVSMLAEPLGRTSSKRSAEEDAVMELVLYLFINLLRAQPLFTGNNASIREQYYQAHDELVTLMHQELVLDIVSVLAGDLEQADNAPYNLLVLELLHSLWKPYHPAAVARAVSSSFASCHPDTTTTATHHQSSSSRNRGKAAAAGGALRSTTTLSSSSSTSLLGRLQRERQSYAVPVHTRHSHFGGTLQINRRHNQTSHPPAAAAVSGSTGNTPDDNATTTNRNGMAYHDDHQDKDDKSKNGTTAFSSSIPSHQYVSAVQFMTEATASSLTSNAAGHYSSTKYHSKHGGAFAASSGGGRHSSSSSHYYQNRSGPSAQRAQVALHSFLQRLVQQGYGPMTKSLKGEFRRDSVRLQEDDGHMFLEFIWFVVHWWRLQPHSQPQQQEQQPPKSSTCSIGPLLSTMDIFTLDLIFRSMDTALQQKQYEKLSSAVAVWLELLHLLYRLLHSKDDDESDQVIALGLLDRLYYNSEPLDRLPKLVSQWEPGTTSREYVADLVELVHVQLKLLEGAAQAVVEHRNHANSFFQGDATVQQMRQAAQDFDWNSYIRKKLVSAHTIGMYIELLGHFEHNTVTTNHRIVSFLKHRVAKQVIYVPQDDDDDDDDDAFRGGILPSTTVTLQPLLYQYSLLTILDRILNLAPTLPKQDQTNLVPWATHLVHDFSQAVQRNPLLWMEALLLGPSSRRRGYGNMARHCDEVSNVYVPEEFRMLLIKDQLQQQLEAEGNLMPLSSSSSSSNQPPDRSNRSGNNPNDMDGDDDDEEEEEELEFEDVPAAPSLPASGRGSSNDKDKNSDDSGPIRSGSKRRNAVLEDDNDSSNDEDDNDNDKNRSEQSFTKKPSTLASSSDPTSKRLKKRTIIDDDDDNHHDMITSDGTENENRETNERQVKQAYQGNGHGDSESSSDESEDERDLSVSVHKETTTTPATPKETTRRTTIDDDAGSSHKHSSSQSVSADRRRNEEFQRLQKAVLDGDGEDDSSDDDDDFGNAQPKNSTPPDSPPEQNEAQNSSSRRLTVSPLAAPVVAAGDPTLSN
ncbi:hypothetical protein ACA910_014038 [Epithemia clementina (nom. ined.)]